jgi:hypothetical protein
MRSRRVWIGLAVSAAVALPLSGSVLRAQDWKTKPPTAADWAALAKLPDLTGVWEATTVGRGGGGGATPAGQATGARAGTPAPGAARQGGAARAGGPPRGPQLTPEYAARKRELDARGAEDTDTANCLPPGMPGIMGQPYPYEFLLTPGKVTIIGEAYMQVRHVYTDGRPLPADPDPTFHGTSIGRWEGDTLVVETVGFSPATTIAANTPHSDKMKIVERIRLTAPDVMTIDTTVTDPEALSAPFVSTRTLARHRDWTVREYICEENNRNFVDPTGKAGIKLDAPGTAPAKKE